jgi:hypothetical protein
MRINRLPRRSRDCKDREFYAVVLLFCCVASQAALAQDEPLSRDDRSKAKERLHIVQTDIREHYFDKRYQGLDVDARFKVAEKKIEAATTMNYALADIAGAVDALNDYHTFFIPPPRPYKHSYGWEMQAIGTAGCFVTAVRPGSDAGKKCLRPGDQVLSVKRKWI